VTSILLVGAGAVGSRAGRQLVDTDGLEQLVVVDRSRARSERLAADLGSRATVRTYATDLTSAIADVDAVALAIPGAIAAALARSASEIGRPVATVTDDEATIAALFALDGVARERGSVVVPGCALVPGLSEVLAIHASLVLDRVEEVHVARVGAAGDACIATLREARRQRPLEWRDGQWASDRRRGPQLLWFPEPIGARECIITGAGIALLRDALPNARHATVRVGDPPVRRLRDAVLARRRVDDGWGACRVEVWGWRGEARDAVVYGVVERPAVAVGTVLAVAAARLAGLLAGIELTTAPLGVVGLGRLVEPVSFLAELDRRGVKAAAFEGIVG
jgi:shikimate/quinate 5-dehydrogenase